MIELIYARRGEGKSLEAANRAANWIRNGGTVVFLTPGRYPASHVEQVVDLIEHDVPEVRERLIAASVGSLSDVQEQLRERPADGVLVIVDGASEIVGLSLGELRRAGMRAGLVEMLALTFDFARAIETRGYRVLVTLAED